MEWWTEKQYFQVKEGGFSDVTDVMFQSEMGLKNDTEVVGALPIERLRKCKQINTKQGKIITDWHKMKTMSCFKYLFSFLTGEKRQKPKAYTKGNKVKQL